MHSSRGCVFQMTNRYDLSHEQRRWRRSAGSRCREVCLPRVDRSSGRCVLALVQFPEYWAIATGIVFIITSGLFTSKVLLGLEGAWAVIGMAPEFGVAWLAFFWLLFK